MRMRLVASVALLWCVGSGCSDDGSGTNGAEGSTSMDGDGTTTGHGTTRASAEESSGTTGTATTDTSSTSTGADESSGGSTGQQGDTGDTPLSFVAVTFNTGGHADGQADVADEWYGNGLAWIPAVEQTTAYLASLQPDIVAFQEIFYSPDCADIPVEFHAGYVCESWSPGDPTVAEVILGSDYQIACHLGKTDKCAAVKKSFGTFVGCDEDLCLDGLDGGEVDGCGNGSRVGRGVIELAVGGQMTVVSFHGTSGILPEDQLCRVAQVDQVFVDLDGAPAANGDRNLVLGDFNTDPARAALLDLSAARWNDFVGDDHPFHFVTEVGANVLPTYAGSVNIDHQVSDTFEGDCWHPGITPGEDPVVDFDYFDHVPAVCSLTEP